MVQSQDNWTTIGSLLGLEVCMCVVVNIILMNYQCELQQFSSGVDSLVILLKTVLLFLLFGMVS